ncbi:fimbrial biogenesis chaperone [Pseudomonas taetrolens]|uniref:fimbrial biogenesis chaperone n=1 Tax=Pseudomonas taetrolens TaxID=47884 RepID=UPI003F97E5C7
MHYSSRVLPRCFAVATLCLTTWLSISPAQAGIVISGSRQVYPAQEREITVQLSNEDKKLPRLVQVWLDAGNEKLTPEQSDVPFTITPPVFRIEGGKSQALRLSYTQEPLPTDKESVFWLNVLEVPPVVASSEDQLRFSFRIRSKVFFRPQGLAGTPQDAGSQLRWSLHKTAKGSELEVHNPSVYHVSFQEVALALGATPDAKRNKSEHYTMVAPGGRERYPLKDTVGNLPAGAHVAFSFLNDYGTAVQVQAPLQPATH